MLDSSPDALPPIPRPLKRSASVASLPTPPRTHHKRTYANRSLRGDDSDTDRDESSASETEPLNKPYKNKKQRISSNKSAEEEEDAFWLSKSDGDAPAAPVRQMPSGLVYRRLAPGASTSSVGSAPVSPPPSHRKPAVVVAPVTPESRRSKYSIPVRDSPNNPFLVSPASIDEDSVSPTPSLSPHTPHQEQPTVTYVFRGVRGSFPNPLYDHEHKRPRSPSARSRLPVEHPDYSPDAHCGPKVLFPMAPRKPKRATARLSGRESSSKTLEEELRGRKRRSVSIGGSDSEDEEEEEAIMPKKLDFTTLKLKQ